MKNAYLKPMLLFMAVLLASGAWAQTTISGVVTSAETGESLPGVNITEKGTTRGTVTDVNGAFNMEVSDHATLVFSYVGFVTQEISVGNQSVLKVSLAPEMTQLKELVVIGYGTQEKSHFAGAVAAVDAEKQHVDESSVESLDKALQGRLAGVQIRDVSGQVGLAPEITIRGKNSFSGSNAPLIVIDGLPLVGGDLRDVDMADVQKVEVLKDAASSAIYGSRGANGVIMITTKKGSWKGRAQFEAKLSSGISDVLKYFETFEDYESFARNQWYRTIVAPWETGFLADGQQVPSGIDANGDPVTNPDGRTYIPFENYFSNDLNPATGTVYNAEGAGYYNLHRLNQLTNAPTPQESVTRSGRSTNLFLSARGGNDKVDYYVSGSYRDMEGVMINNDYQSFSLNTNLKAKLSKKLQVEFAINPTYQNSQLSTNTQLGGALRWLTHPLYHDELTLKTARRANESGTVPLWMEPGGFAKSRDFRRMWLMNDDFSDYVYASNGKKIGVTTYSGTGGTTSYSDAVETDDVREYYKLRSNLALSWSILDDLTFRTSLGTYVAFTKRSLWTGSFRNSAGAAESGFGEASYETSLRRNLINENTLDYAKTFGRHQFSVLAGFSMESYLDESLEAGGRYFEDDIIRTLNYAGEIEPGAVGNGRSDESLMSLFGRVNYSYDDRYMLSAVLRRDGSSQFGPNNRWGTFPSVSAAWRISEEPFFGDSRIVDDLKLRASYGVSGNNRIPRYSYVNGVNSVQYIFGNEIVKGYAANGSTLGNYRLGWEQLNATNLGISVGLLENRISVNADVYDNKTKSLLLRNPIVNISGHEYEWQNIGKIETKGIELELSSYNIDHGDFSWMTTANFSRNTNKLLDYGGADEQFFSGYKSSVYRMKVGRPLGEFYGYKTTGEIWKSSEEITEAIASGMAFESTTPGDAKYLDINGDGKITDDDKTSLGSPYPDFEWGLTNSFRFRNFDLSFTVQGSHGSEVWNLSNILGARYLVWLNEDAYIDEYHGNSFDPNKNSVSESDLFVEDASFIALRDVDLGYHLPLGNARIRVYFSGRNLLYLMAKGYHGINPEYMARISGNLIAGEQRYNTTALLRTYTLGVDVKF